MSLMRPVKEASKVWQVNRAFSLFACPSTPMLLGACGVTALGLPLAHHAYSHICMLTCFVFFPTGLRVKERLFIVYAHSTQATMNKASIA